MEECHLTPSSTAFVAMETRACGSLSLSGILVALHVLEMMGVKRDGEKPFCLDTDYYRSVVCS